MGWVSTRIAVFLVPVCLLAMSAWGRGKAGLDGRLVTEGGPVAGGVVYAYRTIDLAAEPAAVSQPSGPDGRYSLDLAPGTYFLTASAGEMWSWCGQNPVTLDGAVRPWIGFSLSRWPEPLVRSVGEEGLSGRIVGSVVEEGKPVAGVTVSLYFDETDGFRGMGFMRTPPTGEDGVFRMEMVPEGRYFIVARKRESGRGVGPMIKGDLLSYYRFNPVRVKDGREIVVVLPMVEKRYDRDLQRTAPGGERAGFEGIVTDGTGRPVRGVHVFAYRNPEMGHHKPAALSSPTDEKGRYRIYLPESGKYYVGAREGYGDNPAPGEMFGHYEGTPDHSLTLDKDRFLKEVGITVKEVLAP